MCERNPPVTAEFPKQSDCIEEIVLLLYAVNFNDPCNHMQSID